MKVATFIISIILIQALSIVGTVMYIRAEFKQAKFDAQREAMIRVLKGSFQTDYIIPSGQYEGEMAKGMCLDAESSDLAVEYAI